MFVKVKSKLFDENIRFAFRHLKLKISGDIRRHRYRASIMSKITEKYIMQKEKESSYLAIKIVISCIA